jgi:hypothetical protein
MRSELEPDDPCPCSSTSLPGVREPGCQAGLPEIIPLGRGVEATCKVEWARDNGGR